MPEKPARNLPLPWDDDATFAAEERSLPLPWDDDAEFEGAAEPEKQEPSGILRRAVADPAVSLAKGVIGLGEAAVGIANIPDIGLCRKGASIFGV